MSRVAAFPVESDAAWRLRLLRSGLLSGIDSPEAVARVLIGLQAQDLSAAGLAVSARCASSSHADIAERLYKKRSLVKLWGQRNTLHVYATDDWPLVFGTFQDTDTPFERSLGKKGIDLEVFRRSIDGFIDAMVAKGSFGYDDLEAADLQLGDVEVSGWLAGWGDLCLTVERRGPVCHAEPDSGRSRFAHHRQWLPNMSWDPPRTEYAEAELARRYLASYGPATEEDLARWAGVGRTIALRWLTRLGDGVIEIDVDGTSMLVLADHMSHFEDEADVDAHWVRLLGKYDPLLLAHKNKDWIIDPTDRARVWRSGGRVEAVVLVNGQVAGTWRYRRQTHTIDLTIAAFRPLAAWAADGLANEARRIANHFDLQLGQVDITSEDSS